jgi:hypothetical protein
MKLLKTMLAVAAFALAAGNVQAIEKDFNGDGYSDLVWENVTTGQHGFWFMQNQNATSYGWVHDSNGQLVNLPSPGWVLDPATWQPVNPPSTAWRIVGSADFLGDGNADLVWQNSVTGTAQIWFLKNGVLDHTSIMQTCTSSGMSWVPLSMPIVAVGQNYTNYVDITMLDPNDGTIWVQYFVDGATNGERYRLNVKPSATADPNCPWSSLLPPYSTSNTGLTTSGHLQPGWRIAGEFVNPPFPIYLATPQADQNGIVFENTTDGRIAFAHLVGAPGDNPMVTDPTYCSYTISSVRVPVGWHIAGSGKFFGAGNYGDYTSKALGSYTSLVLENATTGQHVIWVFRADYQSLAAGYWLPTQSPDWRVANH